MLVHLTNFYVHYGFFFTTTSTSDEFGEITLKVQYNSTCKQNGNIFFCKF